MIETIQTTNYVLAICGIFGIVVTVGLLIDLRTQRKLGSLVSKWGLQLALLVTGASVLMTLIYSEVFGILPCGLCWFERIALYPQLIILGVALYYKDKFAPRYGIALSVLGGIVSLYHHYIQMGGSQFIKCPAAGAGADCAKRFFFEFGFMTFPLMSAILFIFLIVLYTYLLRVNRV